MENNGVITTAEMRGLLAKAADEAAPISALHIMQTFDQLAADAQRFNGFRMILCERDEALRDKMGEAIEACIQQIVQADDAGFAMTPEYFNELVDKALLAACEARK